jgi:hypothetical protein
MKKEKVVGGGGEETQSPTSANKEAFKALVEAYKATSPKYEAKKDELAQKLALIN